MSALFICVTPLHMLISKKIIDEYQIKEPIIIILAYQYNEKYHHYIAEIKNVTTKVFVINLSHLGGWRNVFSYLKVGLCTFNLRKIFFDKVFFASIDNKFVHLILSRVSFSHINTFDDGTANIIQTSSYYKTEKESIRSIFSRMLMGIKYTREKIVALSELHYTIYPKLENIIANTIPINVFDPVNIDGFSQGKSIKIFLGQPYSELGIAFERIEKFMKDNKIEYYYPHPRERDVYNGVVYINSPKIAEEYIISELRSQRLEVYSIMSSSILNLAGGDYKNLKLVTLCTPELKRKYTSYYDLAAASHVSVGELK
ncbi:glycosyltransferase family 52 [Kluyvera cryocrescens]|uniref:glycosyltransferase family 52 n=1 Tax=Kluyvera cryocrescens TaxID=580 RepID=UPI0039F70E38